MSRLLVGETVPGFNGRGPFTVTARDVEILDALREELIPLAQRGEVITYKDASDATGMNWRNPSRYLDLLSRDCERGGEPSLAALVVRADTMRAGEGFAGDDHTEARNCFRFNWV